MLEKQLEYIRSITDFKPETAVVLGSGLGGFANQIVNKFEIDFKDIPSFPVSTAPTHSGKLVFGTVCGKKIMAMKGRIHLYEGYSKEQVVMPIRLARLLGAEKLILTNAAGGINSDFKPGDLMLITDHISSFVSSPLIGRNDDTVGERFPDMSNAYSLNLRKIIKETASKNSIDLKEGVYIQFTGPQFETPAEIKAAKLLGADAVGMSTAIEAIAAVHCGLEVAGISLITNYASGISGSPITSREVEVTAEKASLTFSKLIKETIGNI